LKTVEEITADRVKGPRFGVVEADRIDRFFDGFYRESEELVGSFGECKKAAARRFRYFVFGPET